jgi:hypothetical protein
MGFRSFAALCLQLTLILFVVQCFEIESKNHFFPVLSLAVAGFVIHAWLPRPLRLGFFTVLSLAGIIYVLGPNNGAWVIGLGGGLIACCRLPAPLAFRVALVAVAGLLLAALRVQFPEPFWPVLGSMFMFRLIIYLFELRRQRRAPPLGITLSYFFPLPNSCFLLFPVLDFQTFHERYYDADETTIYQTGVAWIVRGISHLLVYRFIKAYLLPSPHELGDPLQLTLFLAMNYGLYLHVSGWFHIITGMLHLFGFHLPRTHLNYFLASSVADIWRRINIYWKDFMAKVLFYPAFFKLNRWGPRVALPGAVLSVFMATWLLHTYQMFWLVGELPLTWKDAILWMSVGAAVAGNLLFAVARPARNDKPQKHQPIIDKLLLSMRIVGMFALVSLFWACWTIPNFTAYLHLLHPSDTGLATSGLLVLAGIAAIAIVGVLIQIIARRLPPLRWTFSRSVIAHTTALVLLAVAGIPQVTMRFGPFAAELFATLRLDSYTPMEAERGVRGYYETITEAHVQAGPFLAAMHEPIDELLPYTKMTRPADDLLGRELIPGWSGTVAGKRLTINRFGMRDRDDLNQHKPADACRIALVGSSVVMGYGVADDEGFKCLLEQRLNAARISRLRFELLNFGTGMSWVIQRRVLIDRCVWSFAPDAIYYFAHQDELLGPVRHLARLAARGTDLPYPCLEEVLRQAGVKSGMSWGAVEGRLQPFGREIVLGMYRGLVADCRHRGIVPVWVYLPMPGITEVSVRSAEMIRVAEEAGFVVVNLADWAAGHAPADVKLSEHDHHANALGHRLIAEQLYAAMRQRPELLPRGR